MEEAGGTGDRYIRTTSGPTSIALLLETSEQLWTSPSFTYNGVGGSRPASLTFSMFKRSGYADLLAIGADAEFSVKAVNQSGGSDQVLLSQRSVGSDEDWQPVARQAILADSLKVGDTYVIQIRTAIGNLAAVLPGGNVDYDNVSLVVSEGSGTGGNSGAVLPPPKVISPGKAYLYKGRLFVRIKCPKRFKPACNVRAVVKTKRRKGMSITKRISTRVKSGHFEPKALRIKPRFRKRLKKLAKVNQKTIMLKLRIRSKRGAKRATVYHHLKVLQRRK